MSFWALFLFVLPYLIRGMWRKALSLVLILMAGQVLISVLAGMNIIPVDIAGLIMIVFSTSMYGYTSFNYYYDSFRKNARNEIFWF